MIDLTKYKEVIHDLLFFSSLGIYYVYFFVFRSTIHINGLKGLLVISVFFLFLGIFLINHKYSKSSLIIQLILYLIIIVSLYNNQSIDIIQYVLIILFLINSITINFKHILKFSFICILIMYSIITLAGKLGIIENRIFMHTGSNEVANTFGFTWYNIPSLSIFTLLILYIILKNKITIIDIGLYLIVSYLSYELYTERLIFILLIMYLVMYLLLKNKDIKSNILVTIISYTLPTIMAILSFVMPFIYKINPASLYELNYLLSGRIELTLEAFNRYKITPFGQPFLWSAGDQIKFIGSYFFLDNTYAYALLAYGMIFFIGLIIEYTSVLIYLQKKNELKTYLWVIMIVGGGTIVFDWLVTILFSPCLFLFIKLINEKNIKKIN